MLITSIAPYNYTNRYNTNLNTRYQNQNINFTSKKFINPNTYNELIPIIQSCKDIFQILQKKNDVGLQKLSAEIPNVEFVDKDLIFRNFGKDKKILRMGFLEDINKYFHISLSGETENNYIINLSLGRLEKYGEDGQIVPLSPIENAKNDFEKFLSTNIDEMDFDLLKIRKYLSKVKNDDLKPIAGNLNFFIINILKNALRKYAEIDKILSDTNPNAALKLKREFGDYHLVAVKKAHEFINVGAENLTICLAPIESQKYKNLTRMVVSNLDGEIIDAYLIKDNAELVSNFNKKYPSYIPDKFDFYSNEELKGGVAQKFEKYLIEIDKKLSSFKTFLLKPRTRNPQLIDGQHREFLSGAIELYGQIADKLEKLNPNQRGILKTSCPLIEAKEGRGGFTFVNINPAGEKLSFLPVKNSQHEGLTKLVVLSPDDKIQKIFLLQNDDKLIVNLNPKYPNVIPPTLKIATAEELVESGLFDYLEPLQKAMISLKSYITENADIAREKNLQRAREYNKVFSQRHKGEVKTSRKMQTTQFQQDVRKIRTQSLERLKEAFKEFEKSHNSEYLFNILNRIKTDIIKISNDN